MGRKLYSPTRTISNRGDRPKFIGQFPCAKGGGDYLVYDSLTALYGAIYLEWRPDVVRLTFEPREYKFGPAHGLPELKCIPDFEAVLESGEICPYEAKYSREGLRAEERTKLDLTTAHFKYRNSSYSVIYRLDLEADGFLDTVILMRRYGLMAYPDKLLEAAQQRLAGEPAAPLDAWRSRAQRAGVPIGLLYHLLYHQRLPLVYRPLLPMELMPCRV